MRLGPPFPSPLTPNGVNLVVQTATIAMLGIANTDPDKNSLVRVAWQPSGQPAYRMAADTCIVRAVEVDDEYNRVRDFNYQPNQPDPTQALEVTLYTRVWGVYWVLYGPNSFDRARQIKSALFTQAGHDLFSGALMYLVTDVAATRRVPELFEGLWWERVDLEAQFNEQVAEAPTVGTARSVEVILENEAGVQRDINIP